MPAYLPFAGWGEQFYAGRTRAWFLSFVIWHTAEHLHFEGCEVERVQS